MHRRMQTSIKCVTCFEFAIFWDFEFAMFWDFEFAMFWDFEFAIFWDLVCNLLRLWICNLLRLWVCNPLRLSLQSSETLSLQSFETEFAMFWDFEVAIFWCFEVAIFWDFEFAILWDWVCNLLRLWACNLLRLSLQSSETLRLQSFETLSLQSFEICPQSGLGVAVGAQEEATGATEAEGGDVGSVAWATAQRGAGCLCLQHRRQATSGRHQDQTYGRDGTIQVDLFVVVEKLYRTVFYRSKCTWNSVVLLSPHLSRSVPLLKYLNWFTIALFSFVQ